VWQGLVRKAENPMPFVEAITECTVLERYHDGLLREITNIAVGLMRERVTFEPEKRVRFQVVGGRLRGLIVNEIGEDEHGELALTFRFQLQMEGMESGSPQEAEFAQGMERAYLSAVKTTLQTIRDEAAASPSSPT